QTPFHRSAQRENQSSRAEAPSLLSSEHPSARCDPSNRSSQEECGLREHCSPSCKATYATCRPETLCLDGLQPPASQPSFSSCAYRPSRSRLRRQVFHRSPQQHRMLHGMFLRSVLCCLRDQSTTAVASLPSRSSQCRRDACP